MNSQLAILGLSVWGFAFVAAYVAWTRIRVALFREEIFLIRDALWDKALELKGLDDPAHREARARLNGLIRGARSVSLPTMILAVKEPALGEGSKSSSNPLLQSAIDAAYEETGRLVGRYIFSWTLTGLASRPLSHLLKFILIDLPSIKRWLRTDGPNQLPSDGHGSPA